VFKAITTVGDLCDEANAKKLIDHTIKEFQRIDTLVQNYINCAGILTSGSIIDTDIEVYDRQMDVNVRSVVMLTRLALPHIIKTKGTIVNVSSIAGPCAVSFSCKKAFTIS
ncbi:hypothetical protein COOONC_25330, partial [Cooperia oncophora]